MAVTRRDTIAPSRSFNTRSSIMPSRYEGPVLLGAGPSPIKSPSEFPWRSRLVHIARCGRVSIASSDIPHRAGSARKGLLGNTLVVMLTCVGTGATRAVATVRPEKDFFPNTFDAVACLAYWGETPGGNGSVVAGGG